MLILSKTEQENFKLKKMKKNINAVPKLNYFTKFSYMPLKLA